MIPALKLGCGNANDVTWHLCRPVAGPGWLAVGDAAATVDPAAGQGVFTALWSGIRASETILKCRADPGAAAVHLAMYDGWFVDQFHSKTGTLTDIYIKAGWTGRPSH